MPSVERDVSMDRDLRRQQSFSETGRLSVPMWDSADPDRCPPPLPIPPSSPGLQTKSNASAGIQAAANKLHERARENFNGGTHSPSTSPEKSLIKGAAHRRMQSAHAANGKDLKSYLDGMRAGSPERSSVGAAAEYYSSSSSRPDTPTRQTIRPVSGDDVFSPVSTRKDELSHGGTTAKPALDAEVSAQLQKLTSIATSLQQEMSQLSRRSKDNAADLIGLKEAQKERDNDVRKTLRELMTSPPNIGGSSPSMTRSGIGLGLLDSKPFGSPTPLPRAASHNSLVDGDRAGSPSPFSVEGVASVAMLEKIIREMVTKEGQERLLSTLSELMDKSSKMSSEAIGKVNDLKDFIKEQDRSRDRALAQSSQALIRSTPAEAPLPADLRALLSKIKESVASNGGMTAEVKALIRELRGEILGMGRELGRKLDQAATSPTIPRTTEHAGVSPEHMQQIVGDSINELREHMVQLIEDSTRQSSSLVQARSGSSTDEMYAMVKHALAEQESMTVQTRGQDQVDKDEILTAVRTACENFKPEIELQQYGLERDEILDVLKEGLAEYRTTNGTDADTINKQDVYHAISEALQSTQLPAPTFDVHTIRAEMLASIRECLEDFRTTGAGGMVASIDESSTRELINDAIRTGLAEQSDMTSRVMEISRDDLFDAVKAGLDGSSIPFGGFGEQVLQQLHILVDGMKAEFKQYSAANGRDTEQVLDAVKDGLEDLRVRIESYVDRAQDVTGKDEIIETVRTGLENLRMDVQGAGDSGSAHHRQDMLDYIKSEFKHLHTVIGAHPAMFRDAEGLMSDKSDIMAAITGMRSDLGASRDLSGSDLDTATLESVRDEIGHLRDTLGPLLIKFSAANGISPEVLEAIRGEFENLQRTITTSGPNRADTEEMLDTIRLGLDDLRSHVDKKIGHSETPIFNGEMLDALNEGLDNLRSDVSKTLEKPVDMTVTYEILDTLKEGLAGLRTDMEKFSTGRLGAVSPQGGQIVLADSNELSRGAAADGGVSFATPADSSTLDEVKLLLSKLQIKIEAIDRTMQDLPAMSPTAEIPKEQLGDLEGMLKDVQVTVAAMAAREKTEIDNVVTKDDTNALETLLRNTKAEIELGASREQVDSVEAVARVIKDTTDAMRNRIDEHLATKSDIAVVEVLATDLKVAMDELRGKTGNGSDDAPLSKAHVDALGVMIAEIKDKVLDMMLNNAETLPEKADIEQISGLVNDLRDSHDKFRETYDKDIAVTAQAFDDRKKDTEEILVAVTAIKGLVEEFKNQACDQEESQTSTFDGINETLASITTKLDGHPELVDELRTLTEALKTDLETAQVSLDMIKADQSSGAEKQNEHRDTVIAVVTKKVDDRVDELLLKYQDTEKLAAEHTLAQATAVAASRELTDELKLSIDTLGTTLTTSAAGFGEATERMAADSKTVFNRVDDVYNKLDETQVGLMGEHQATRQEIVKAVEGVAGIQSDLLEHNPKILVSLQELHALVNRHYEHAQKVGGEHSEALKAQAEKVEAGFSGPRLMPAPVETSPVAHVSFDDTALHTKLDALMSREPVSSPNTATLLEKIDEFTSGAVAPAIQLERLDAIHAQMMSTAAEVSAFVAAQTTRIADSHDSREREAEELASQITRHETRKEDLEADIDVLVSERDDLRGALSKLRAEREDLASQKSRLSADVHAMHAALAIRREELAAMETKADVLERRVVEGLMDQSRLALLGRSYASASSAAGGAMGMPFTKAQTSPRRKPKGRDLRVSSANNSEVSTMTASSSAAVSTLGAAMDKITSIRANTAAHRQSIAPGTVDASSRRIMSLGQIHHNAVSNHQPNINANGGRPSLIGPGQGAILSASPRGIEALKRSQSTRNATGLQGSRKSSWNGGLGGGKAGGKRGFTPLGGILDTESENKENDSTSLMLLDHDHDDESRRTSTLSFSMAPSSYTAGSSGSRPTTSGSGSSDSFSTVTASEVAGTDFAPSSRGDESELSRNDSLIASMVAGRVRAMLDSGELDLASPSEADSTTADTEAAIPDGDKGLVLVTQGVAVMDYASPLFPPPVLMDMGAKGELRRGEGSYYAPTDSGLGSDLPTTAGSSAAAGEGEGFGGYFPAMNDGAAAVVGR